MSDSEPAPPSGATTSEPQDPLVGLRMGNYVVHRKIGIGGMASVYLGHHVGLNRPVAIKILSRELMGSDVNIQRFNNEARTAASLEHPNIVTIHDVGESGGYYYIAMQFVDGQSLDRIVSKGGAMPLPDAIQVMRQVAAALAVAHRIGVIHRDVKPANILITPDRVVKVVDFGLARIANANSTFSSEGQILGTPFYMAPEQARGGQVDGRTDIYSLGATFYHVITGERVFSGDTPMNIVYKQVHEEPKPAHEVRPNLPPAVSHLIAKMMAKDPAKRHATAEEVIQDLDELAKALPAGDATLIDLELGGRTMFDLSVPNVPLRATPDTLSRTPPPTATPPPVTTPVPPATPTPATSTPSGQVRFETSITSRPRSTHQVMTSQNEGEDKALGPLAVAQGMITQEQLDDVVQRMETARNSGQSVSMAEMLVRLRLLQPVQILQLRASRTPAPRKMIPGPAADETDIVTGRVVGSYRLVRMIYTDEIGTFWEAQALKLPHPVGLKVARNSDATLAKRLYTEAARAKGLSHPNILRVYEVGTETDHKGRLVHFMATDLVEGRPLTDVLASGETPLHKRVEWFESLAEGLHHAHQQFVIHANLKPSSVFITKDERPLLLYCDLGGQKDDTRVFREQGHLANAPYVAPEQLPGSVSEPNARTDIYRLGTILYEALTGKPPFSGPPSDVLKKIVDTPPTPPHELNAQIDPVLEGIMMKAMARTMADRYETATELSWALRAWIKSPGVGGATPMPATTRAHETKSAIPKVQRRRPSAWQKHRGRFLAAIVLVGSLGPAGWFGWEIWKAEQEAARRQREEAQFQEMIDEATRLHAEGKLAAAIEACDKALRRGTNERLASLSARARSDHAAEQLTETTAAVRAAGYLPAPPPAALAIKLRKVIADSQALSAQGALAADPRLPILEGLALRALQDPAGAHKRLEEAVRRGSRAGIVNVNLARLHIERWMLALAVERMLGADCEIRDRSGAWLQRAAGHLRVEMEPPLEGLDAGIWEALTYLVEGDADGASRACDVTLRQFEKKPGREEILVLSAWLARDPQRRLKLLDQAIEIRPHFALALTLRGAEFLEGDMPERALRDFEAALRATSSVPLVNLLAALGYAASDDHADALVCLDRALALEPDLVDAINARARTLMALGKAPGALKDAEAAVALRPEHRGSRMMRGRARAANGRVEAAIEDFTWAAERDPNDPVALTLRGEVRLVQKNADGAITDFDAALKIDPRHYGAWLGRGAAREAKGEFRAAADDYQRAYEEANTSDQRTRAQRLMEEARKKGR